MLVEGVDFYYEDGLMVFTKDFLLRRGKCCKSGCQNCPYGFIVKNRHIEDSEDKLL